MLEMKKVALIIAMWIIFFLTWLFFFAPWIVYKTVPYKWDVTAETIVDSTFYTGKYVKINDSLRIVIESGEHGLIFDKYVVQEQINNKWEDTDISRFVDLFVFDTKHRIILTLQSDYEKSKKQKPITLFK